MLQSRVPVLSITSVLICRLSASAPAPPPWNSTIVGANSLTAGVLIVILIEYSFRVILLHNISLTKRTCCRVIQLLTKPKNA